MFFASISESVIAVTACETDCRLSSLFSAVTITSSNTSSPSCDCMLFAYDSRKDEANNVRKNMVNFILIVSSLKMYY